MGSSPNRLVVADARGHGASLRVTRHPQQRKVVLSHWRNGICVASTPVEVSELPGIISVLADALGEAAQDSPGPPPRKRGFLVRLRDLVHPVLAVIPLLLTGRRGNPTSVASSVRSLASVQPFTPLDEGDVDRAKAHHLGVSVVEMSRQG
jgi:hypothetical protein